MRIPAALRLTLLAACMALPAGCPKPTPGPGSPGSSGIVVCTTEAIRDNALALIPRVNDCLTAPSNWEACLIGLINPVANITEDVLACTVQTEARRASAAVEANPKDDMSGITAERARGFIKSRGYIFAQ